MHLFNTLPNQQTPFHRFDRTANLTTSITPSTTVNDTHINNRNNTKKVLKVKTIQKLNVLFHDRTVIALGVSALRSFDRTILFKYSYENYTMDLKEGKAWGVGGGVFCFFEMENVRSSKYLVVIMIASLVQYNNFELLSRFVY